MPGWRGVIREYRDFLPMRRERDIVTLCEGDTLLLPARALPDKLGKKIKVYFKYEGQNPTGSFKDRGMTYAVSKAVEEGATSIVCASTGNTSSSAAAYAARAGIKCYVFIPEGKIAFGKLAQALVHGAEVVQIKGNFDEALAIVVALGENYPLTLVNSINPYRLAGQQTAAYEVCDALGRAPDKHFIPVGNAGNITAYWRGYVAYKDAGRITRLPRMFGWQASGAAPIVRGKVVANPETVASAIRIGNPVNWESAKEVVHESHGDIGMVTDKQIVAAYQFLSKHEGIFCEPSSAACVAGLIKIKDTLRNGETIVCTLTGHGLKDPDTAIDTSGKPKTLPAKVSRIAKTLGF